MPALSQWVRPQLTQLVDAAPDGDQWLHEVKYDGYHMHARHDRGAVKLLTRTGLDWTHKYPAIAKAVAARSMRARPISTANCAAWAPTAPRRSTSFSSRPTVATRRRSCSFFSIFSISTARISLGGLRLAALLGRCVLAALVLVDALARERRLEPVQELRGRIALVARRLGDMDKAVLDHRGLRVHAHGLVAGRLVGCKAISGSAPARKGGRT
jgi:hypothetical protein